MHGVLHALILGSLLCDPHTSPEELATSPPAAPFHLWAWHAVDYPALVGWSLAVDGTGTLEFERKPAATRVIALTPAQVGELIHTLERERIFDLAESYGTGSPNSHFRVIDVWLHGKRKRLLIGVDLNADPRRDEVSRALRVWAAIRGLFTDDLAIDTREEDRALIRP